MFDTLDLLDFELVVPSTQYRHEAPRSETEMMVRTVVIQEFGDPSGMAVIEEPSPFRHPDRSPSLPRRSESVASRRCRDSPRDAPRVWVLRWNDPPAVTGC